MDFMRLLSTSPSFPRCPFSHSLFYLPSSHELSSSTARLKTLHGSDNETPSTANFARTGGTHRTMFATDTPGYLGQSVAWQRLGKLFLRIIFNQLRYIRNARRRSSSSFFFFFFIRRYALSPVIITANHPTLSFRHVYTRANIISVFPPPPPYVTQT